MEPVDKFIFVFAGDRPGPVRIFGKLSSPFWLTRIDRSSIMEEFRSSDMAVLNIKNFPDSLYKKLQARAKRQHRSIAQEVTHLLSDALETAKPLSILDLQGLCKEHWKGIDASRHIERERASWD